MFWKKRFLKNLAKFTGNHLWQNLFLNYQKRGSGEKETLIKKRPWHRCFPVNFANFLRTIFIQNTSGGYFCSLEPCNCIKKSLQHRRSQVKFVRFPISYKICERLLVKNVNFLEFFFFLVVFFKDFRTAIFKTPPNDSILI